MVVLMEDIMLEIEPHKRFYNHVFIGLLSLKIQSCDECQRVGNISRPNEMPMNYSLVIEPFDCWGFDFMGPLLLQKVTLIYLLLLIMLLSG